MFEAGSQRSGPTRVRCVSIFLDKNRRYIGTSQPKRPPERKQRTPHQAGGVGGLRQLRQPHLRDAPGHAPDASGVVNLVSPPPRCVPSQRGRGEIMGSIITRTR